ncbi:MAG TPA: hypothetical protein VFR80_01250 [Pyrinomonadaceae bacterium]|nr:hypothetical protein [Pyrinomonadaceae bacterium]
MRIARLVVCFGLFLLGMASGVAYSQTKDSREVFWEKFRTAVIKKDKITVANLSEFPISMPYGMRQVRSKAQLIKRYRDVFNHEGDAAVCFADAKPGIDAAKPKEFTVGCKNAAGDEVVIYFFLLTKNGWRFNGLDNINE